MSRLPYPLPTNGAYPPSTSSALPTSQNGNNNNQQQNGSPTHSSSGSVGRTRDNGWGALGAADGGARVVGGGGGGEGNQNSRSRSRSASPRPRSGSRNADFEMSGPSAAIGGAERSRDRLAGLPPQPQLASSSSSFERGNTFAGIPAGPVGSSLTRAEKTLAAKGRTSRLPPSIARPVPSSNVTTGGAVSEFEVGNRRRSVVGGEGEGGSKLVIGGPPIGGGRVEDGEGDGAGKQGEGLGDVVMGPDASEVFQADLAGLQATILSFRSTPVDAETLKALARQRTKIGNSIVQMLASTSNVSLPPLPPSDETTIAQIEARLQKKMDETLQRFSSAQGMKRGEEMRRLEERLTRSTQGRPLGPISSFSLSGAPPPSPLPPASTNGTTTSHDSSSSSIMATVEARLQAWDRDVEARLKKQEFFFYNHTVEDAKLQIKDVAFKVESTLAGLQTASRAQINAILLKERTESENRISYERGADRNERLEFKNGLKAHVQHLSKDDVEAARAYLMEQSQAAAKEIVQGIFTQQVADLEAKFLHTLAENTPVDKGPTDGYFEQQLPGMARRPGPYGAPYVPPRQNNVGYSPPPHLPTPDPRSSNNYVSQQELRDGLARAKQGVVHDFEEVKRWTKNIFDPKIQALESAIQALSTELTLVVASARANGGVGVGVRVGVEEARKRQRTESGSSRGIGGGGEEVGEEKMRELEKGVEKVTKALDYVKKSTLADIDTRLDCLEDGMAGSKKARDAVHSQMERMMDEKLESVRGEMSTLSGRVRATTASVPPSIDIAKVYEIIQDRLEVLKITDANERLDQLDADFDNRLVDLTTRLQTIEVESVEVKEDVSVAVTHVRSLEDNLDNSIHRVLEAIDLEKSIVPIARKFVEDFISPAQLEPAIDHYMLPRFQGLSEGLRTLRADGVSRDAENAARLEKVASSCSESVETLRAENAARLEKVESSCTASLTESQIGGKKLDAMSELVRSYLSTVASSA